MWSGKKCVLTFIAGAMVVVATSGAIWYQQDRPGMLGALCKAGLPNFSRPSIIEADDLDCAILGARRRLKGVLLTSLEVANLVENDLPPPPAGGGFTGNTWMTCSQVKGCDGRMNRQLDQKIAGLCGARLASFTAYGWATETPGHFGHLGVYAREFFVDEVVAVGPPPASLVEKMRRMWREADVGDCS